MKLKTLIPYVTIYATLSNLYDDVLTNQLFQANPRFRQQWLHLPPHSQWHAAKDPGRMDRRKVRLNISFRFLTEKE